MSRQAVLEQRSPYRRGALLGASAIALALLSGCGEDGGFSLPSLKPKATEAAAPATGGRTVERDVEAPEIFSANEQGLWDGRPSLGGVWVAHPDVDDPERVIIRNEANGKFVVGALFRREREIPGPKLQISSDAAEALGVLAGAPVPLNVTALKREEVAETPEPMLAETDAAPLDAPSDVAEAPLDPIASAEAAIDASAATPVAAAPVPEPTPTPPPAPAPRPASTLAKPFIQIGIFSVEANAERTAKQMRNAGLVPTVRRQEANGKPFWRVLVGPATSKSELGTLLETIKGEGFTDAYAVTN